MCLLCVSCVSPATRRQALQALLFWCGGVLKIDQRWLTEIDRPHSVQRLPVVLTVDEVRRAFTAMDGTLRLIAQLLYRTGMRIMKALRLQVKNVEFDRAAIIAREAKLAKAGGKDRRVMLPDSLRDALTAKITHSKALWQINRADSLAGAERLGVLAKKYRCAAESLIWHWGVPQATCPCDSRHSITRRRHFYDDALRRALARVVT